MHEDYMTAFLDDPWDVAKSLAVPHAPQGWAHSLRRLAKYPYRKIPKT
jgi:hypothetical protein